MKLIHEPRLPFMDRSQKSLAPVEVIILTNVYGIERLSRSRRDTLDIFTMAMIKPEPLLDGPDRIS